MLSGPGPARYRTLRIGHLTVRCARGFATITFSVHVGPALTGVAFARVGGNMAGEG